MYREPIFNPYKILGVKKNASLAKIKDAFRKLALIYHPDKNAKKNPEEQKQAEEHFKEIQKAYEMLSKKAQQEIGDDYPYEFKESNDFEINSIIYQLLLNLLANLLQPDKEKVDIDEIKRTLSKLGGFSEAIAINDPLIQLRIRLNQFYADPESFNFDEIFQLLIDVSRHQENYNQKTVLVFLKKIQSKIKQDIFENICNRYLFTMAEHQVEDHDLIKFLVHTATTPDNATEICKLIVDICSKEEKNYLNEKILFEILKKLKPQIEKTAFKEICTQYLAEKYACCTEYYKLLVFLVKNSKLASYTPDKFCNFLITLYMNYKNHQRIIIFRILKIISTQISANEFEKICVHYLLENPGCHAENGEFLTYLIHESKRRMYASPASFDINKKDKNGLTILAHAVKHRDNRSILILTDPRFPYVDLDANGLENLDPELRQRRFALNKIHEGALDDLEPELALSTLLYLCKNGLDDQLLFFDKLMGLIYAKCVQVQMFELYYFICNKYFSGMKRQHIEIFLKKCVARLSSEQVNILRFNGVNILCQAIISGCGSDFIRHLVLDKGVKTDITITRANDYTGYTPLLLAAELMKNEDELLSFVSLHNQPNGDEKSNSSIRNFKINDYRPDDALSALHVIAQRNFPRVIAALLKIPKINVNQTDVSGKTPLMYAVTEGLFDNVIVLLQSPKINLNLKDIYGKTVFDLAKTPEMTAQLLKYTKDNNLPHATTGVIDSPKPVTDTPPRLTI